MNKTKNKNYNVNKEKELAKRWVVKYLYGKQWVIKDMSYFKDWHILRDVCFVIIDNMDDFYTFNLIRRRLFELLLCDLYDKDVLDKLYKST